MKPGVYALLLAQFLTAFADNAILFTVIAMVMSADALGDWYVPALQSAFLVAFVVLAPWVGRYADAVSKRRVLVVGNIIKALGVALILIGVEPIFAYAVVGAGAAVYGPAKYGILPELVGREALVKANGWIEGSTILAIVVGTVVGARLADTSISGALVMVLIAFALSIAVSLLVPAIKARGVEPGAPIAQFRSRMRRFFVTPRARFSMLGASLFWAAAAVLRVALVAWAPIVLMMQSATDIASLTLVLAVGIIVGSALATKLISLENLRRARLAAYATGFFIIMLAVTDSLWSARVALFLIGVSGGLFVVPVNAALQELGFASIGSGGAVAIQSFFENLAMLIAVGLFTLASARAVSPVVSLYVLGGAVLVAAFIISWRLPNGSTEGLTEGPTEA